MDRSVDGATSPYLNLSAPLCSLCTGPAADTLAHLVACRHLSTCPAVAIRLCWPRMHNPSAAPASAAAVTATSWRARSWSSTSGRCRRRRRAQEQHKAPAAASSTAEPPRGNWQLQTGSCVWYCSSRKGSAVAGEVVPLLWLLLQWQQRWQQRGLWCQLHWCGQLAAGWHTQSNA